MSWLTGRTRLQVLQLDASPHAQDHLAKGKISTTGYPNPEARNQVPEFLFFWSSKLRPRSLEPLSPLNPNPGTRNHLAKGKISTTGYPNLHHLVFESEYPVQALGILTSCTE